MPSALIRPKIKVDRLLMTPIGLLSFYNFFFIVHFLNKTILSFIVLYCQWFYAGSLIDEQRGEDFLMKLRLFNNLI
jgi:hypothetical protein